MVGRGGNRIRNLTPPLSLKIKNPWWIGGGFETPLILSFTHDNVRYHE